jgi:hypothetical protein
VNLKAPGGSLFFTATNAGGVGWVELWMNTKEQCGGTIVGPGLAGAPTKHVDGTLTPTTAPNKLSVGFDINLLQQKPGCTYTYEVWAKAANAATTRAIGQSSLVSLVMNT